MDDGATFRGSPGRFRLPRRRSNLSISGPKSGRRQNLLFVHTSERQADGRTSFGSARAARRQNLFQQTYGTTFCAERDLRWATVEPFRRCNLLFCAGRMDDGRTFPSFRAPPRKGSAVAQIARKVPPSERNAISGERSNLFKRLCRGPDHPKGCTGGPIA